MIVRLIGNSAPLAWLVFAVLAAVSAMRFGMIGFDAALRAATPTPVAEQHASPRHPPPVRSSRPTTSASVAPPTTASGGEPLVLTLAVTAGSPRSWVYVNGRSVGRSPFFGDISCRNGNPLRIEIVPEKGQLIALERSCRRGMIRIDDNALSDPYAEGSDR